MAFQNHIFNIFPPLDKQLLDVLFTFTLNVKKTSKPSWTMDNVFHAECFTQKKCLFSLRNVKMTQAEVCNAKLHFHFYFFYVFVR